MTELNTILFVGLGLVFIIVARNIEGTIEAAQIEQEVDSEEAAAEEIRQPENVNSLLQVDPIELEFGYGIIPLADVNQGGESVGSCGYDPKTDCAGTWYGGAYYPFA